MHWCIFMVCACLVGTAAANVVKMEMGMKDGFDHIKDWNPEVQQETDRNSGKQKIASKSRLGAFKWENCGDEETEAFHLETLEITPDPISIPGAIFMSISAVLNVTVNSNWKAKVQFNRNFLGMWIPVPCFKNVGSCTYNDLCKSLSDITSCPTLLKDHNIPCHCPVGKGTYVLPTTKFTIDAHAVRALLRGNYKIVVDSTVDGKLFGCYEIYFELE